MFINLVGKQFGKLTVVARASKRKAFTAAVFRCKCSCGKETEVVSSNLRKGASKSCGSYKCRDTSSMWPWKTHGMCRTREHVAWVGMKARCFNKNCPKYRLYGGRGITVCKRWMKFENFLADMGKKPPGLMLDRLDNGDDYKPSNCRWASMSESNKNRRPFKRGPSMKWRAKHGIH